MAKKQVTFLTCFVVAMLFATSAGAQCGALGIVTNAADSSVAAPGEVLLDDGDIFMLNLITESSVAVSEKASTTKRVSDGVVRTESQDFEIYTTLGKAIGISVSCTHQGCNPAVDCQVTGCEILVGGRGCSRPTCTGINCEGTPKGCTKTVTSTEF